MREPTAINCDLACGCDIAVRCSMRLSCQRARWRTVSGVPLYLYADRTSAHPARQQLRLWLPRSPTCGSRRCAVSGPGYAVAVREARLDTTGLRPRLTPTSHNKEQPQLEAARSTGDPPHAQIRCTLSSSSTGETEVL